MSPSITKKALPAKIAGDVTDDESPPSITLAGSTFFGDGQPILTEVPKNITTTSTPSSGCFVGFHAEDGPGSRHVAHLGKLQGIRFMSIFRFKVWWTTHWVGTRGRDVEHETQMMLFDRDAQLGRPYVLILPILEGPFRASLQPAEEDDYVDVCVESGSSRVVGCTFQRVVYMRAGHEDPYGLVRDAIKELKNANLGTSFQTLEDKTPPGIVDKFGWCTWDAFYLTVHPQGVWDGVKGLVDGGTPPGMVLIDDGWQSIAHDDDDSDKEGMSRTAAGEQMPCRLVRFQENFKFGGYVSHKEPSRTGMAGFLKDLKDEFKTVEHVYVWHALCGYWGGVRPGTEGMPAAELVRPKLSPGIEKTMEDLAVDKIVQNGVGLVPPERVGEMYKALHSYLESVGIDGVKVDVIDVLEMLAEEYGGRVELARAYYNALTDSIKKHFNGNGVIASMQHCNDFMLLGTDTISLGRVGDDFWCADPAGDPKGAYWLQGCHMVHCAYNSLWMSQFIHPDWDMFQSTHPCAYFHAASRAISGGPVYVSDSVGSHDFDLLKKLVLPDGSILRCRHYALPTKDCLFQDPLHDGNTILKIWNLNKYTGVLGLFNCQGGGWYPEFRRNASASTFSRTITTSASPSHVEWTAAGPNSISVKDVDVFAVYMLNLNKLRLLKPSETIEVSLDPFKFELMTVSPVAILPKRRVQFAPIGLVNMMNSGGAIVSLELEDIVKIGVRGCGEFRVFASERPTECKIDGKLVKFLYEDQMVSVEVDWPGSGSTCSVIEYLF